MKLARSWLLPGCAVVLCAQPPEIARNGVVNAASDAPSTLTDSVIARGAVLTIRGARFGPPRSDSRSAKLSGPAGEKALTIKWADFTLASARVPDDAPLGPASLTIMVDGQRSPPFAVKVVAAQFGIYANNGKGWGPGRIQNVAGAVRTPNSVSAAANFGQTLALSGTGLGDAKSPAVLVGGRPAKVLSARASADGDEILFEVPANAPQGCFVPVQVHNAGRLPSNIVTVAIHKGGGACIEPEYFPFAGWVGKRVGIIAVTRSVRRQHGMIPLVDDAGAWFGQLSGVENMNPYFLLPPPGTCTSQTERWRGETVFSSIVSLLAFRGAVQSIRAGDELSIDDGKAMRRVPLFQGKQGIFDRELSDSFGRADRLMNFESPTILHVTGRGGADMGRFGFALEGPKPFHMRDDIGAVRRGHALRLAWADMGAGRIAIVFGDFADEATGTRGMCYCVGTPGATGLTIPASALTYFPPASRSGRISVTVVAWPLRPVVFQAAGLDHALAISSFMQAATQEQ